jgi:hypothetical protein
VNPFCTQTFFELSSPLFRHFGCCFQLAIWHRVKSFTWKYSTDAGTFLEFNRNPSDYYVERIEDAYNKYRYRGIYEPFAVEGCPCTVSAGPVFTCGHVFNARPCSQIGSDYVKGRLMIIDFKNMKVVDGGVARQCDPVLCPNPNSTNGGRCGLGTDGFTCYSAAEKAQMLLRVKGGCATTPPCFSDLPNYNDATGAIYSLVRQQTGVSNDTIQNSRIVPYNDRPSVGGGGASLRFDGVNDMAAATVGNFPKDAFTVMIWVKGTQVSTYSGTLSLSYSTRSCALKLGVSLSFSRLLLRHSFSSSTYHDEIALQRVAGEKHLFLAPQHSLITSPLLLHLLLFPDNNRSLPAFFFRLRR